MARVSEPGWMDGIEAIHLGRWVDPETGAKAPRAPVEAIALDDDLDGREAALAPGLCCSGVVAVVADPDTWDAMGARLMGADAAIAVGPGP